MISDEAMRGLVIRISLLYHQGFMPLKAVVLVKTLIVRQPVSQSLATLDFEVIEFTDLSEVMTRLEVTAPSLVVMDADGMAREWRMLAARLGAAPLVLLSSRFTFDDVHQAMALNVAGVILKPFRKEEHVPRLLDLALRQRNLKARRSYARFRAPETTEVVLKSSQEGIEESFPVRNIAQEGVKVNVQVGDPVTAFKAGAFIPMATLLLGDAQLEVAVDVIHRQDDIAGIRFSRFFDSSQKLIRLLEERQTRALGSQGRRRKW
jgi:DNA-binding NarL/FixJ family response regulator